MYFWYIKDVIYLFILYYMYNKIGNEFTIIYSHFDQYKKESINIKNIPFNYIYCKPILITHELSILLNIKNQLCNYYELITLINNYLYDKNLVKFQYVKLNSSLQTLLSIQQSTMPYYTFIETLFKKHIKDEIYPENFL